MVELSCSKRDFLLDWLLFLEFFRVSEFKHRGVELAVVVFSRGLISLQNASQFAVQHVQVELLETVVVGEIYFVKQPLIPHELDILVIVHQLLKVEPEFVLLISFKSRLNVSDEFDLFSLCIQLQFVHLELSPTFNFVFIVLFLVFIIIVLHRVPSA